MSTHPLRHAFTRTAGVILGMLLLTPTAFSQMSLLRLTRAERGLHGPVHRVVSEIARISEASGEWLEGPRKKYSEEVFDASGNLVEMFFDPIALNPRLLESVDGQETDPDLQAITDLMKDGYSPKKYVYAYNKNGKLSDQKILQSDGTLSQHYKYDRAYDENGRTIDVRVYKEDGSLYSRDVYSYDENGNVTEEAHYTDGGLIMRTCYTFDEGGNLASKEVFDCEGRPMTIESTSYDDRSNTIVEALHFDEGVQTVREISRFDDRNRILECEEFDPDGALELRQTYEYVNDAHDNWTRQITRHWSSEPEWKLSFATYRAITYFGEQ